MKIQILGTYFASLAVSQSSTEFSPKLDLSIEGMRSQQFSEGVFVFLLVGMFSKNRSQKMKVGERFMFTAIILGVAIAIIFGAVQMLGGYLF